MERYILVKWPESQLLMEHERFNECLLVQDLDDHVQVGSSAYMCPESLHKLIFNLNSDCVNFQVAKNLSELGFDEPCFAYYAPNGSLINDTVSKLIDGAVKAPTINQACEWLKNKFNDIIKQ